MNVVSVVLLLFVCPGGVLLGWGQQRNQSGVRIGTGHRQVTATGPTNIRGGSGIKIGSANKSQRNYTKPTTLAPLETPTPPPNPPPYSHKGLPILNVGLVVPLKSFGLREYNRAVSTAVTFLNRTGSRTRQLSVFQRHQVQFHMVMNSLTPTPTGKS
ncbi:hypothetical protein J6590_042631 [Homalodisca vitripennis]|nr:hypothetical protein J6590_042631 [Homalodisca vitripennis]